MKKIKINTINGIVEIEDFDDDILFENNARLDTSALESYIDNIKNDLVMQWLISDEQFDFLKERYGIKAL